jgi:ribosomal protein L36
MSIERKSFGVGGAIVAGALALGSGACELPSKSLGGPYFPDPTVIAMAEQNNANLPLGAVELDCKVKDPDVEVRRGDKVVVICKETKGKAEEAGEAKKPKKADETEEDGGTGHTFECEGAVFTYSSMLCPVLIDTKTKKPLMVTFAVPLSNNSGDKAGNNQQETRDGTVVDDYNNESGPRVIAYLGGGCQDRQTYYTLRGGDNLPLARCFDPSLNKNQSDSDGGPEKSKAEEGSGNPIMCTEITIDNIAPDAALCSSVTIGSRPLGAVFVIATGENDGEEGGESKE